MRIERVKLTNFRRFREAEIQFPDGLICLVGKNGSGKSTILESISWAIYGHSASRTNKELIKRRGSGPNEPVEVELSFELGGNQYSVKRSMVGQNLNSRAEVRVNGKLILSPGPKSSQECTNLLSSMLHLDEHSFHTSLIARQKELDMLSQLRAHERKSLIMKMLRVDVIDKAIDLVRRDIREKKNLISHLDSLMPDISKLEEEQNELEGSRRVAEENVEKARGKVDGLRERVEEANEKRKVLKTLYERYLDFKENVSIFLNRVKDLEERIREKERKLIEFEEKEREAGALASAPDELKLIDKELAHLEEEKLKEIDKGRIEAEIEEHTREAGEIKRMTEELKLKIEPISEVLNVPVEDVDSLNDEIFGLKLAIQEIARTEEKTNSELEEIAEKIENIRALGPEGECPTCERKLGPRYRLLIKKYNEKEEELRRTLNQTKKGISQKSASLESLSKRLKEVRGREERRRKLEGKLNELEVEIREKERRLYDLWSRVLKLEEGKESLKNEFDMDRYTKLRYEKEDLEKKAERHRELVVELRQKEDAKRDLLELKEKRDKAAKSLTESKEGLTTLRDAELSYDRAIKEFEVANEELKKMEIALERLIASLNATNKEIERIQANLLEGKKLEGKIGKEKGELRLLNELAGDRASLLVEFRDDVIARIRPGLSIIGSELLSEITNGKYDELSVDDDYRVWIYEDGESFPIERFSGGESDVANLCLRIAISRLVAERSNLELDFIALDEIFGSQDLERRENILNALGALLNRFSQVVLITHIEGVREKIPNLIEVVEEEDGTSSIQ